MGENSQAAFSSCRHYRWWLARCWGYGGVEVLNLFARIAASPAALRRSADPVGSENDRWLQQRLRLLAGSDGAWRGPARLGARANRQWSAPPSPLCGGGCGAAALGPSLTRTPCPPMARTPSRYAIHLLLAGGHSQVVHFPSLDAFQQWYGTVLNAGPADAFINVPITDLEAEYLVLRPSAVLGIRVEPIYGALDD